MQGSYAGQDVVQIFLRIDVMPLAAFQQRIQDGTVLSGFRIDRRTGVHDGFFLVALQSQLDENYRAIITAAYAWPVAQE